MNSDTPNFQNKAPQDEAFSSETNAFKNKLPGSTEIKEYGKKSLAPLIDLLSKYKGEFSPYFKAIETGLQGGFEVLNKGTSENDTVSDAQLTVGEWFRDAANWFNGADKRLQSGNTRELLDYLEQQAKNHPTLMFSSSYIAGLFFGRIGRHLGRQYKKPSSFESQDFGSDSLKH